jgi:hypothetical protein
MSKLHENKEFINADKLLIQKMNKYEGLFRITAPTATGKTFLPLSYFESLKPLDKTEIVFYTTPINANIFNAFTREKNDNFVLFLSNDAYIEMVVDLFEHKGKKYSKLISHNEQYAKSVINTLLKNNNISNKIIIFSKIISEKQNKKDKKNYDVSLTNDIREFKEEIVSCLLKTKNHFLAKFLIPLDYFFYKLSIEKNQKFLFFSTVHKLFYELTESKESLYTYIKQGYISLINREKIKVEEKIVVKSIFFDEENTTKKMFFEIGKSFLTIPLNMNKDGFFKLEYYGKNVFFKSNTLLKSDSLDFFNKVIKSCKTKDDVEILFDEFYTGKENLFDMVPREKKEVIQKFFNLGFYNSYQKFLKKEDLKDIFYDENGNLLSFSTAIRNQIQDKFIGLFVDDVMVNELFSYYLNIEQREDNGIFHNGLTLNKDKYEVYLTIEKLLEVAYKIQNFMLSINNALSFELKEYFKFYSDKNEQKSKINKNNKNNNSSFYDKTFNYLFLENKKNPNICNMSIITPEYILKDISISAERTFLMSATNNFNDPILSFDTESNYLELNHSLDNYILDRNKKAISWQKEQEYSIELTILDGFYQERNSRLINDHFDTNKSSIISNLFESIILNYEYEKNNVIKNSILLFAEQSLETLFKECKSIPFEMVGFSIKNSTDKYNIKITKNSNNGLLLNTIDMTVSKQKHKESFKTILVSVKEHKNNMEDLSEYEKYIKDKIDFISFCSAYKTAGEGIDFGTMFNKSLNIALYSISHYSSINDISKSSYEDEDNKQNNDYDLYQNFTKQHFIKNQLSNYFENSTALFREEIKDLINKEKINLQREEFIQSLSRVARYKDGINSNGTIDKKLVIITEDYLKSDIHYYLVEIKEEQNYLIQEVLNNNKFKEIIDNHKNIESFFRQQVLKARDPISGSSSLYFRMKESLMSFLDCPDPIIFLANNENPFMLLKEIEEKFPFNTLVKTPEITQKNINEKIEQLTEYKGIVNIPLSNIYDEKMDISNDFINYFLRYIYKPFFFENMVRKSLINSGLTEITFSELLNKGISQEHYETYDLLFSHENKLYFIDVKTGKKEFHSINILTSSNNKIHKSILCEQIKKHLNYSEYEYLFFHVNEVDGINSGKTSITSVYDDKTGLDNFYSISLTTKDIENQTVIHYLN